MKIIIAGGRDYCFDADDINCLDSIDIHEVVSGGASGADAWGELYAHTRGLLLTKFMADWKLHGRAAGPIRNRQMSQYADGVVLFPGGKGTNSMYSEALKAGIKIYDFRSRKKGNNNA